MKSVTKKLNQIQTTLKAPKGQYNKFGKYAYRNAEDILEAVKPLLKETKTVLVVSDQLELIGDRFYVKATSTLTCIETAEEISSTAYAREAENKKGMDESQITGATSSYARKYSMNGLFAIDDNKDADSQDNSVAKPTTSKPEQKKEAPKKTSDKTAVHNLDALVKLLQQGNKNAEAQLINSRFITKEQKDLLKNVLDKKVLDQVEVR